jgi:hypothetical protein
MTSLYIHYLCTSLGKYVNETVLFSQYDAISSVNISTQEVGSSDNYPDLHSRCDRLESRLRHQLS